ncbi:MULTISPECIES: BON domain-containing protein [Paraburkholderia]|jgi:hyperosmotically inducible periplasmic protein|uniref:BON domain-containing protein n=1 Tax=Paraburkholderia TaxID=1822464 RepID=UPI00224F050A|nr:MULTISPECIES: BON domain-containing protein [Paraburkholderia]MCX4152944.1 BON domain-containing protein [Paraburkholderia aspalathi]MDN7162358.1 BON domain-containing protein [Paraburkholderia sp. SECH2]MDQ6390844.1 BON domain-containing protein [Paraburkholderia aspalathi]
MKTIKTLGLAVAALFVAMSATTWCHADEAASSPSSAQGASTTAGSGAVATTGRKADRALRRKVYAAIGKYKEINAGDISVIAKDGAVTLNGTVTEATQISKVEAIARGVPGVTSVTNKLTVKKPFGGM